MNFYHNFLKCCNQVGKTPSRVMLEIGSTKSAVTRWRNGGLPSDVTLQKLADYFGVSADALAGDELDIIPMEDNKKEPSPCREELSEYDMKVLAWFRSLPEEKRQAILTIGDAPKDLS